MPRNHRTGALKSLVILLYKIGTGVPFDLGELIFRQISRHAESISINLSVGYPSLIFCILMSQNVAIAHGGELCEKEAVYLCISKKFFPGNKFKIFRVKLFLLRMFLV